MTTRFSTLSTRIRTLTVPRIGCLYFGRKKTLVFGALFVSFLTIQGCRKAHVASPQTEKSSERPTTPPAANPPTEVPSTPLMVLADRWGPRVDEASDSKRLETLLSALRSATVRLDDAKPIGRQALSGDPLAQKLLDSTSALALTELEAGFLLQDLMDAAGVQGQLVHVRGDGGKTSLRRRTLAVRWGTGDAAKTRGMYRDDAGSEEVSDPITPEHRTSLLDGITALHWIEMHAFDRALDRIQSALKRSPKEAALRFLRGKAIFLQGDMEAGLLDMEQAVTAQEDATGQHQLAIAYIETEQSFKAYRALRRAVTLEPKSLDAWIGLGFLALERYQTTEPEQRGDIINELNEIEKAVSSVDSKSARLVEIKARRLLIDAQRDEAKTLVTESIKTSAEPAVLRAFLAELAMQAGDSEAAIDQLEQALKTAPDESDLWLLLASLYGNQGEADKAINALEQGVKTAPFNPQIHAELVRAYQAVGQSEKAKKAGQELVKRFPGRIEGSLVLIEQALMSEDHEGVIQLASDALKKHPQDVDLYQALFLANFSLERNDAAKQAVDRLVKIDPKSRLSLAEMFLEVGMLEPSLFLMEQEVAADPSQSENAINLALLYRRLRKTDDEQRIRTLMLQHASDPKAAAALYAEVSAELDTLEQSLENQGAESHAP